MNENPKIKLQKKKKNIKIINRFPPTNNGKIES